MGRPASTPYQCPACYRQVFLAPPPATPLPSGAVMLDLSTTIAALNLHLRVGCEANR